MMLMTTMYLRISQKPMITVHLRLSMKTLIRLKANAKKAHLPLRVFVSYLMREIVKDHGAK